MGTMTLSFPPYRSDIYLSIQYKKQNELHLHACLKGRGKPLSSQLLIFTFLKFPWVGVSTFSSILLKR